MTTPLPDDIAPRARGMQAQPVRWGGQEYPSISAALRARTPPMTALYGNRWRAFQRAVAAGEIELLPVPGADTESGAYGAMRRIVRAAIEIRDQSTAQAEEGLGADGTRVELRGRRRGLVRALWNYRQRFGHGVTELLAEQAPTE